MGPCWYDACMHAFGQLLRWLERTVLLLLALTLLGGSSLRLDSPSQRVRRFTRNLEFDFVAWTARALGVKVAHSGLAVSGYLNPPERKSIVEDFLAVVERQQRLEAEILDLFGAPSGSESQAELDRRLDERAQVSARRAELQPTAEAILQEQAAGVLLALGFGQAGAAFPPVAFRFSSPPHALIVSPRHVIRQDANVQLDPALEPDRQVTLEMEVESALNVSALVVPVGGIGTFPTMIMDSSSLPWITEVIIHEWVHNYLAFRPLGWNYDTSQELRTMNETTASILGKELGRRVLEAYYPSEVPPPPPNPEQPPQGLAAAPSFDFRQEMRVTRERVDDLLAQDKVDEAETYMEARRLVFWEHGFRIRRLNQAYFAFHGTYADQPGGAAGEDPVGAAVRSLWQNSPSPAEFLNSMAWMNDPQDLFEVLQRASISAAD